MLQEVWRESAHYDTPQWVWVQSGRKPLQHQGVAIFLNHSLCSFRDCKFEEIMKGRLLKVLVPAAQGHPLRRRPITLLCAYQRARSSEPPEIYHKRHNYWQKLDRGATC